MSKANDDYPTTDYVGPDRGLVPRDVADFVPAPVMADGGFASDAAVGPPPSVSIQTYLAMLVRHKWLVVSIFLLVTCVAVPLIWMAVIPTYRATAVVRVSPVVPRVLYQFEENGILPLYSSYLNTQVSVIRSPKVLQRVLDQKDVQGTSWYREKPASFLHGPIPDLQRLTRSLAVSPRRGTELIDVAMVAEEAADAKLIVDTVVEQYLDVVRKQDRNTEKDRVDALHQEAESLHGQVQTLTTRKNVVSTSIGTESPDEYRLHITVKLSKYQEELDALVRQRKLNEVRLARLTERIQEQEGPPSELAEGPETLRMPVRYADDAEWRKLQQAVDAGEHQLNILRDRYGEQHPKIKDGIAGIDFAKLLLSKREAQLDDPDASPVRTAGAAADGIDNLEDPAWIETQIALAVEEEALLLDDIKRQEDKVRLVSERAHELGSINLEIADMQENVGRVRERLKVLDMEAKAPGRVSVAAISLFPSEPFKDRRLLLTVVAVLGAFGCGVGAAFLRGFLDPSVRQAGDVSAAADVPFLGYLPKVQFESDLWSATPDGLHEAMRMIRTALLDRVTSSTGSSVLITSSGAQAGKTSVAILLAKSLSQIGKKILLVDADLRRPSLTRRLGLQPEVGLTDVLAGSVAEELAVVRDFAPGVDVLPTNDSATEHDSELIASRAFGKCLRNWKRDYDFVLFDSPPILPVADARILASQVDGAILTFRASHCRKTEAIDAVSLLASSGCRPLGTVLVGVEKMLSHSYSYAYAGSTNG